MLEIPNMVAMMEESLNAARRNAVSAESLANQAAEQATNGDTAKLRDAAQAAVAAAEAHACVTHLLASLLQDMEEEECPGCPNCSPHLN